jgi:hypothetical protein
MTRRRAHAHQHERRYVDATDEDLQAWWQAMRKPPIGPKQDDAFRVMRAYRNADRRDADAMCKAGHWRQVDKITEPIAFRGSVLPWPFERVPLHFGGSRGVYL